MSVIDVPKELERLLHYRKKHSSSSDSVHDLLDFLAEEADPQDVLKTLASTSDLDLDNRILSILQTCTTRAAKGQVSSELSGSLLKLRRDRQFLAEPIVHEGDDPPSTSTIWQRMSNGSISLGK